MPFTPVEDRAVSYGLQQIPLDAGEGTVFFGLAGSNATADIETIPFLQPEREPFLEYDLTKMVYALSQGGSGTVGLIGELKLDGDVRMGPRGRTGEGPRAGVAH